MKMPHRHISLVLFFVLLLVSAGYIHAQPNWQRSIRPFQDVTLMVDTTSFSLGENRLTFRGEPHLSFRYSSDETVAEFRLITDGNPLPENVHAELMPTSDIDQLDPLTYVDGYYRTRLRFKSISSSDFLAVTVVLTRDQDVQHRVIHLFPYTETRVNIYPGQEELFVGEEKRLEIVTNHPRNLQLDGVWRMQGSLEYRLVEHDGKPFLSVIPSRSGEHPLQLNLQTKRPFLGNDKSIRHNLPPMDLNLTARGSRLAFLRMDKKLVVRKRDHHDGVEVQIDHHRQLQMNKTYRLEASEERGSPLVAELYTQRLLSNDRVLCILRPYANHRMEDGYLYVKDGDNPQFITNVDIYPEPSLQRITLLREGSDWTESRNIRPGETFDIRIEGEGLRESRFYFEDLEVVSNDTITRTDHTANYRLRVPVDIKRKTVEIFAGDRKMGPTLQVVEFQRPRPLDFVTVDYGEGPKKVSKLTQTILYSETVRDVVIDFDPDIIDMGDMLYGKQIIEMEIRLLGNKNELIEYQKVDHVEVCPGHTSPREAFYHSQNCQLQPIRVNSLLTRKTHTLREWSRIEIIVRHKKDRYGGEGYTQRVAIVQQRSLNFDIDLSFPAGLVTKLAGEPGFPTLTGVSLAMIAQFTFYKKGAIMKPKPYKIGAGFLAQNAFNFNPEAENRDLGIVIIGSLYPTRQDARLSFPLYAGGGYFLSQEKFFFLLGPGIRISL